MWPSCGPNPLHQRLLRKPHNGHMVSLLDSEAASHIFSWRWGNHLKHLWCPGAISIAFVQFVDCKQLKACKIWQCTWFMMGVESFELRVCVFYPTLLPRALPARGRISPIPSLPQEFLWNYIYCIYHFPGDMATDNQQVKSSLSCYCHCQKQEGIPGCPFQSTGRRGAVEGSSLLPGPGARSLAWSVATQSWALGIKEIPPHALQTIIVLRFCREDNNPSPSSPRAPFKITHHYLLRAAVSLLSTDHKQIDGCL